MIDGVPFWLVLLLMAWATFRLTRLIIKDTFSPITWARTKIQHARRTVTHRVDVHDHQNRIVPVDVEDYWWFGELVGCGWCASAYVSGALTLIVWGCYGMPMPVLVWLAVWGAGAYLVARTG